MSSISVTARELPDAVAARVASLKAKDAFAPVIVWAPNPVAARHFTRAVGANGGAVNVRFLTGRQLAGQLANRFDPALRMSTLMKRELVRNVLADNRVLIGNDGSRIVGNSPLVVKDVARVFDVLRSMSSIELEGVLDISPTAAELVQLYARYRELASRFHDDIDMFESAAANVCDDTAQVVVGGVAYASPAEAHLGDRLALHAKLSQIDVLPSHVNEVTVDRIRIAPDPGVEAQLVVADVLRAASQGMSFAQMVIVHPRSEQYGALLRRELDAAGVGFRGRTIESLAQSLVGSAVMSLVDACIDTDSRDALFNFFDSAPLRVSRESDRLVPVAEWKRSVVEMREFGGAAAIASRARARNLVELAAFCEEIVQSVPPRGSGWAAWVDWMLDRVVRYLGDDVAMRAWSDDISADANKTLRAIGKLRCLDGLSNAVDLESFRGALAETLSSATSVVGAPESLYVGHWSEIVGADFDKVFACGLGEGLIEPKSTGLVNAVRLPLPREPEMLAQSVLMKVMAAAGSVAASFARADTSARRERRPASVLVDLASARAGRVVGAGELTEGRLDFTETTASFTSLLDQPVLSSPALERLAEAALVSDIRSEATVARASADFTRFDGRVGPVPLSSMSPTALEHWAVCPFRYFLKYVLQVERRASDDDPWKLAGKDRGILMHEVLESFVLQVAQEPVYGQWSSLHREQLHAIADAKIEELRIAGKAPKGVLAETENRLLHANLDRWLDADASMRISRGVAASAAGVEVRFDDFEIPRPEATPVRFHGRIDRVDTNDDGSRVHAIDYKTGKPGAQKPKDPVEAGQRLQLGLYAAATAERFPNADVDATYWHINDRDTRISLGCDTGLDERLAEVVGSMASGIEGGVFPMVPGSDEDISYENCRYCDYDSLCPVDRGEMWSRKSSDDAVQVFRNLDVSSPGSDQ